jgi:hypothetical protein
VVLEGGGSSPAASDGNSGVLQHNGDKGKVGGSFDGRWLGGTAHRDGAEMTVALQSLEPDRG